MIKQWFTRLLLPLIAILSVNHSWAAEPNWSDSIAMANTAYSEAKYDKAIAMYESVLNADLESVDLYYNLGNAYYKTDAFAKAIWSYEKTLLLKPNHEDAKYNLKLANLKVVDKIEPLPQVFTQRVWSAILSFFSSDTWTVISIILFWFVLAGGFLYLWSKKTVLKKIGLFSAIAFFFVAIIVTGFAYGSYKNLKHPNAAIIFAPNVYVKSAPEEASTDLFLVHQGLKVKTLDQVGNWYKIKLADGKVGWLPTESVAEL